MRRKLSPINKMPLSFSYIKNLKKPIPYTTKTSFNALKSTQVPSVHGALMLLRMNLFLEKQSTCGHTIVFMSNSSHYMWNGLFKALLGPSPPFPMRFLWSNFFQLSNSQFAKGYLEFCPFINWAFVFKTSLPHSVLHPIQHPIYLRRLW